MKNTEYELNIKSKIFHWILKKNIKKYIYALVDAKEIDPSLPIKVETKLSVDIQNVREDEI